MASRRYVMFIAAYFCRYNLLLLWILGKSYPGPRSTSIQFSGWTQKFDLNRLTKLRFLAKWYKHLNWSWLNLWWTQMDMQLFPKIYMMVRGICLFNVTGYEVPSFIDETLGSSPCYWLNVRMQSAHLNIWTNNQRYLSNLKVPRFI